MSSVAAAQNQAGSAAARAWSASRSPNPAERTNRARRASLSSAGLGRQAPGAVGSGEGRHWALAHRPEGAAGSRRVRRRTDAPPTAKPRAGLPCHSGRDPAVDRQEVTSRAGPVRQGPSPAPVGSCRCPIRGGMARQQRGPRDLGGARVRAVAAYRRPGGLGHGTAVDRGDRVGRRVDVGDRRAAGVDDAADGEDDPRDEGQGSERAGPTEHRRRLGARPRAGPISQQAQDRRNHEQDQPEGELQRQPTHLGVPPKRCDGRHGVPHRTPAGGAGAAAGRSRRTCWPATGTGMRFTGRAITADHTAGPTTGPGRAG